MSFNVCRKKRENGEGGGGARESKRKERNRQEKMWRETRKKRCLADSWREATLIRSPDKSNSHLFRIYWSFLNGFF